MSDEITKEIDLSGFDFSSIELNGVSYDSKGNKLTSTTPSTSKLFEKAPTRTVASNAVEAVELNKVVYPINDPDEAQAREQDITEVKGLIADEALEREIQDNSIRTNVTSLDSYIKSVEADLQQLQARLNALRALVPPQASEDNQLADKDFVNSSIASNTSNFIGTFNTLEELESQPATNNDYAFWKTTDELGAVVFKRYKYVADDGTWQYEYDLNNSSFTAEQWATINSGLTADVVVANPQIPEGTTMLESIGIKGTNYQLGGKGGTEILADDYEDLPESKKMDGTAYFIPNADSVDIKTVDDNVVTDRTTFSSEKITEDYATKTEVSTAVSDKVTNTQLNNTLANYPKNINGSFIADCNSFSFGSGSYNTDNGSINTPPNSSYGTIMAYNSQGYTTQIAQDIQNGTMFIRKNLYGTWGSWYKIADTNELLLQIDESTYFTRVRDLLNWVIDTGKQLPFSFNKEGNKVYTDSPFNDGASEFNGLIYGYGSRVSIIVTQYTSGDIFIGNYYRGWGEGQSILWAKIN